MVKNGIHFLFTIKDLTKNREKVDWLMVMLIAKKSHPADKMDVLNDPVNFSPLNLSTLPNQPTFAALWLNPGQ